MLRHQKHYSLGFSQAKRGVGDWYIAVEHSNKVTGKSKSNFLLETDDSSEHLSVTSEELGARLYYPSSLRNLNLFFGLYARMIGVDIRYYIDDSSAGLSYLAEKKSLKNTAMGVAGGIESDWFSFVQRVDLQKDFYEIVSDTVHIDRARARISATKLRPSPSVFPFKDIGYQVYLEGESSVITIDSEPTTLEVQLNRMSLGIGLRGQW
jgi:hypothetical protein